MEKGFLNNSNTVRSANDDLTSLADQTSSAYPSPNKFQSIGTTYVTDSNNSNDAGKVVSDELELVNVSYAPDGILNTPKQPSVDQLVSHAWKNFDIAMNNVQLGIDANKVTHSDLHKSSGIGQTSITKGAGDNVTNAPPSSFSVAMQT